MEIRAKAKYLKISAQKVRLLTGQFKNKKPNEVLDILKNMPQKSAGLIIKVIKSAMSNAENNYNLKKDDLILSNIIIEEGPSYKRMKPRARGGRDIVKKRTSHITVILTSPEEEKPKIKKEIVKEKPQKVEKAEMKSVKKVSKTDKKSVKKEEKKEIEKEKWTKEETEISNKPQVQEQEKKPVKEKRPFFQRFFRRKGGM